VLPPWFHRRKVSFISQDSQEIDMEDMDEVTELLSIDQLDFNTACEKPFPMTVISPSTGLPTKIVILVVGREAKVSKNYRKSGKSVDEMTTAEKEASFIETCVTRTVGWKGLAEEFTPANARRLYTVNSMICRQVWDASNEVSNFLKV
jgi:hypothetical protein